LAQKAAIYYRKAASSPQRFAEVQALLERALELDPSSVAVMTMLATVMMNAAHMFGRPIYPDDLTRAECLISRARDISGSSEDVLMAHGTWLRTQLRFVEARDVFQQIVDTNPSNSVAQFMLGVCVFELGYAEAAIPLYETALRLDPSGPDTWLRHWRIGEAALLLGDNATAINSFRQALVANPDNSANNRSRINLGLASAFALLGELDQARIHVSEANRIWPFHTVRGWHLHLPLPKFVAMFDRVREGLRQAGLRDHADEDEDFGVMGSNQLESNGTAGRTPMTAPGITTLRTARVFALLTHSKPLVIDTIGYGRSLPGAVGLPYAGGGGSFEDGLQDRLRFKMQQLTRANAAMPIVTVGWNSERWSALNLALRLVALGYTNVNWYRGGRESWELSELPQREIVREDW
jgi:tetratricopeptide (TPR) repeat protein